MLTPTAQNEEECIKEASSETKTPSRSLRYLLVLLTIPMVLFFLPFISVRSASYQKWTRTIDFPNLEFAFTGAAGQNAEIVIYGDSTAKTDIDPSQMSAALNKKVLNLPTSLSTLMVDDDLPLRNYLKVNRAPRLIVFYFAPWGFDYGNADFNNSPLYNGMEMLMRHGTAADIWSFYKTHAGIALQFPLMFYSANARIASFDWRKQASEVAATNGHMDVDAYFNLHYDSSCVLPASLADRVRMDWVRKMSEKYKSQETKVLYFAAPIPDCANAQTIVDRAATILPAAPPRILPASFFVDDNFYAHLYEVGVPQATRNLIDAVRPFVTN